jgi:hypothetical protein
MIMKTKFLLIVLVVLVLGASAVVVMRPGTAVTDTAMKPGTAVSETAPQPAESTAYPHTPVDSHAQRVPAFQSAAEVKSLPATLPSSTFVGKAREAYEVAKKIPETLAQLPCYCECDQAFGHKSLHTCFVDDHASHCAVCVDEALLAYSLQKVQKLTPEQVREKIIEKYSTEHQHQH